MTDSAISRRMFKNRFINAIVPIAAMMILAFAWLGFEVYHDPLKNTDELKTAERAREMLLLGRSTVHDNFHITFAKPPLQYWLTAATLSSWQNREMAVRVWPLLYGCLTTVALAWLALLVEPRRAGVAILSVALLLSCPFFLTETSRALLDSGLTFFATLALVFAQLARKRPIWWIGVALACSLGALQKIPLIFAIWLLLLLVRICSPATRATLGSPWLLISFVVAIVLTAVWPAFQYWKWHPSLPDLLGIREAAILESASRLGRRPYLEIIYQLCGSAWIFGLTALAAPLVLLWRRKTFTPFIVELSIVSLAVLVLAVLFNFRSVRYVMPILPCLIFLLAVLVRSLFENGGRARGAIAIFILVLIAGGIAQAEVQVTRRRENVSDEKAIARVLGEQQSAAALILVRAHVARGGLLDLFYLFYGNLHESLTTYSIEQLRSAPPSPPVAGVCVQDEFPAVRNIYPDIELVTVRGKIVCWRTPPKSK